MQIKYSPQCSDNVIQYGFQDEIIIATLNGEQQIVDLAGIDKYPEFGENEQPVLELPFFILSVKTEDGTKKVELLKFHGPDAPEAERFGFDWMDCGPSPEYEDLANKIIAKRPEAQPIITPVITDPDGYFKKRAKLSRFFKMIIDKLK